MNKLNSKWKIFALCIALVGLMLLSVGLSYSFLSYEEEATYSNTISAGTLSMILENESENINMINAVPQKDEMGIKYNPEYSFSLKNTGTIDAKYEIYLKDICNTNDSFNVNGEVIIPDYCVPIEYINAGIKIGNDEYEVKVSANGKIILDSDIIDSGVTLDLIKLKIWMNIDTPNDYNKPGEIVLVALKLEIKGEQITNDTSRVLQNIEATYTGGKLAAGDIMSKNVTQVTAHYNDGTSRILYGNEFKYSSLTNDVIPELDTKKMTVTVAYTEKNITKTDTFDAPYDLIVYYFRNGQNLLTGGWNIYDNNWGTTPATSSMAIENLELVVKTSQGSRARSVNTVDLTDYTTVYVSYYCSSDTVQGMYLGAGTSTTNNTPAGSNSKTKITYAYDVSSLTTNSYLYINFRNAICYISEIYASDETPDDDDTIYFVNGNHKETGGWSLVSGVWGSGTNNLKSFSVVGNNLVARTDQGNIAQTNNQINVTDIKKIFYTYSCSGEWPYTRIYLYATNVKPTSGLEITASNNGALSGTSMINVNSLKGSYYFWIGFVNADPCTITKIYGRN